MTEIFDAALQHIGRSGRAATFVQIGAMDGVTFDEAAGYINMYGWTGLYVEPVPWAFAALLRNKSGQSHRFEASAISVVDGPVEMLVIDPAAIEQQLVHPCFAGMSAVCPPRNGLASEGDRATVERFGRRFFVNGITLPTLFRQHNIDAFDIFLVDTEGHDWVVFEQLDLDRHRPKVIRLEQINLSQPDLESVERKLRNNGYVFEVRGQNIDAVLATFWETIVQSRPSLRAEVADRSGLSGDSLRHFFRVWKRVERREPLVVARYADGEEMLMRGDAVPESATVGVEDGWWTERGLSRLGRDLRATLGHREPEYLYAIPGRNDLAPIDFYLEHLQAAPEQLTFANLFCNLNYPLFLDALDKLSEGVVLMASKRGDGRTVGRLRVLEFVPMEHDCVHYWEHAHAQERARAVELAGRYEQTLFLVAAGPMSEVLIDTMYRTNPTNRYLDVGSSLDELIHGRRTRPYMDFGTSFSTHISRF